MKKADDTKDKMAEEKIENVDVIKDEDNAVKEDSKPVKESKKKNKKVKAKVKRKIFKKRYLLFLLIILYVIFRIIVKNTSIIPEVEQLSKVERRDIATSISATGSIKSVDTKDVSESTMTGMTVETVNVKEGDVVNTGDVICTFNTDALKSTLSQLKSSTSGLSGLSGLSSGAMNKGLDEGVTKAAKESVEEAKKAYEQSNSSLESVKTQLNNAQNELNTYQPTYDAAVKKFDPIRKAYNQKQEEYNSAREDHNMADTDFTIAETEYYKYYHRSTKLLREEYDDGTGNPKAEFVSEIQKAKLNLNNAEKARDNAIIVENTKLKELQTYQRNTYNPANAEYTPIELKYNQLKGNVDALQAQKTALEKSTETLRSTYLNLSTLATAASSSSLIGNDFSSSLSGIGGDMSSLNAQIAQMQKQIDNAVVKSPVSGTVTAIGVSSGSTYTGSTIVRIENCQSFEIEAFIDEYDIPDVQKGMDVRIKTDATREEVLNGKVTYVAISSATLSTGGMDLSALTGGMSAYSGMSTSGGSNASYKVKIEINTPNNRLRAGMNAKLSIITGEAKNILSVPYESVFERDDGTNYIKVVKPEYDIKANMDKADEKYNKLAGKPINVEGSSTYNVLADSLENNVEEVDVKVGIEGTYYIEITSENISEGAYVIVPKANSDNSLTQLFELMGADAGI